MSLRIARTSFKRMFKVELSVRSFLQGVAHLETELDILQTFYSNQRLILEKTLEPGEPVSTKALDVIMTDYGYDNATQQLEELSEQINLVYNKVNTLRREAKQLKRNGVHAFSQLRLHQRRRFLKSKFLNGGSVWE